MSFIKINGQLVNSKIHFYKVWKNLDGYKKVINNQTYYFANEFMGVENVLMLYV